MEQYILNWLSSHIAMVATWVISLGAIATGIKLYGPKVRKFIKIGRGAMDIVDTLLDALQDDKITDEEVTKIIAEVNAFKEDLR